MDELSIIKQILAGDAASFSEIIRGQQKRLYGVIYRIVRHPQDAEDIMQETFINAYQKLNTFKGDSALFTWLCAIAYNNARQFLRKQRWQKWLSLEPEVLSLAGESDAPEANERRVSVEEALMKLSLKHRTALILFEVEGLGHEEIARIMGCPVGTVWSYLSRAKDCLRKSLKGIT